MACDWTMTSLGRTGLSTSRLGLASSFGVASPDVERAFERGINYFYWGSYRLPGFGRGVKNLSRGHRDRMVVVVQSYTRVASLMRSSLESALRKLGTEYADVLLLGWWNARPPRRIMDAALALRETGRCRHVMISCHNRPSFVEYARDADVGALMIRYNAAHPGAESEVFPHLGENRPGVVAYTATRWGDLLNRALVPEGTPVPRASDCYRFVLTHPMVDVCTIGPKNGEELDEAMAALDRGAMDAGEIEWMKRVGAEVKKHRRAHSGAIGSLDWIMGAHTS